MTTPLVEFRGLDFLSALADPVGEGHRLNIVSGFLAPAEVRGTDYVVAARPGRSAGNRVADVLRIRAEGRVLASTPTMFRSLTDELMAVLDEAGQDPAVLTVRGPYLGLDDGSTATITVRVKNFIEGRIIAGGLIQSWSIEFESVDPAWAIAT